jgi:hypothetical protein
MCPASASARAVNAPKPLEAPEIMITFAMVYDVAWCDYEEDEWYLEPASTVSTYAHQNIIDLLIGILKTAVT